MPLLDGNEVLVGIFTGKCHEEQRKGVAQEKWLNIVTQNRPVTCGSKNLKRENWVFEAHPFGRKETKTRILFITLDHDPLCSNYFKTLKLISKRKFLSKQQISGQGQRKNKIFFF